MALFNTLKQILTPYANKINLHTEEIDDLQENVNNGFANLESEIGVTSPEFEVVTGQYINNSGLERSGSNFDRSEPISISAHSTVAFSAVGYNQGVAMIATCDENGGNIKAAVISIDSSLHTYTYYTEIDTYIIVSYIKSQSHNLRVYNHKSNEVLNRKISEIETITINRSHPTYNAEQGKYINSAGQKTTSQNFSISSPIKIESNSLVLFTAKGYLQSVSIISLCDANGENIVPIVVSINSDVETYSYFADNECYIILSYYTSAVHELSVQGQTSNVSLAANISTVADGLATAGKDILSEFNNITCIGDSLTYSAVFTSASSYRQAYKPYPLILKSKTGTDVETIAEPGATATSWWGKYNGGIIEKSNHLTIIYLGTNSGLTDTMDTDMVGNDYTQWADTNTGNYGKIVAKSIECGSRVILVKCCKSSGDVDITNSVIEQMAERFSVAVVKNPYLSDIKYHYHPNGSGFNSTHYNDFGYSVFASQLIYNISNLPSEMMKRILPV